MAAILLWINTPEHSPHGGRGANPDGSSVGFAMFSVVILAAAQGLVALRADPAHQSLSSAIMLLHGAAAIGMSAFLVGPGIAVRVGVWSASIGVFASLGMLSFAQVLPRAVRGLFNSEIEPAPQSIAYGFGAYALEAIVLLTVAPAMIALARCEHAIQRVAGIAIFLGIAVVAVLRLMAM
jgi:hypothetical protein